MKLFPWLPHCFLHTKLLGLESISELSSCLSWQIEHGCKFFAMPPLGRLGLICLSLNLGWLTDLPTTIRIGEAEHACTLCSFISLLGPQPGHMKSDSPEAPMLWRSPRKRPGVGTPGDSPSWVQASSEPSPVYTWSEEAPQWLHPQPRESSQLRFPMSWSREKPSPLCPV